MKELHRNGVDQCNKAIKRLLNKREKCSNEATLTELQRKQCRKNAVTLLDYMVDDLTESVKDIDRKVTVFQKEMAKEFRSAVAEDDDDNQISPEMMMKDQIDESDVCHGANGIMQTSSQQQHAKKERAAEREWDPHQHAYRKRKNQFSRTNGSKQKQQRSSQIAATSGKHFSKSVGQSDSMSKWGENQPLSVDNAAKGAEANFEHAGVNFTGETNDLDNEHHLPVLPPGVGGGSESKEAARTSSQTTLRGASVDFTGETDDTDDKPFRSILPAGIGGGLGSRKRQSHSNELAFSRAAPRSASSKSSAPRHGRPMSESMTDWLKKQSEENTDTYAKTRGLPTNKTVLLRGNSARRKSSGAKEVDAANQRSFRQSSIRSNARARTNTRQQQLDVKNVKNHDSGIRSSLISNNDATAPAQTQFRPLTRPSIPNALSADFLFDSLSTGLDINNIEDEECEIHSENDKTLEELCQMLKEEFPARIQYCHKILALLATSILRRGDEEPRREHITILLRTLLFIFERKCTTFLDILQTELDVACFQIDCWCLVCRILEAKWNGLLRPEHGIIFKVFGNCSLTLNNILLQVIDALYSQLLWEEYGATPIFNARAFGKLSALCVRIGKVVPLLPAVCTLLKKLGPPRWHASLTNKHKENDLVKGYYVSAIDPLMHKRFLSSGEPLPKSDQPRMKYFKYMLPRREIEAAWSIIGFVSRCATTNGLISTPNVKPPQDLLCWLLHCNCGTLPNRDDQLPPSNHQLPPSKFQVDTCSKEITWVGTLLSSKMLGDLPLLDSVVKQIIERSVMLEAFDNVLNMLPSSVDQVKIHQAVEQLWRYSCITGSSVKLELDLGIGLMNSLSMDQGKYDVCSIMPSAVLLQRCVSLAVRYAMITMTKKPRWKGFRAILLSLASEFDKRASELEEKSENRKAACMGALTADDHCQMMQQIIETATKLPVVDSAISSHFREAACHVMLAGVVARSRHNAPGEGNHFTLNKDFRDKVSVLLIFFGMIRHS